MTSGLARNPDGENYTVFTLPAVLGPVREGRLRALAVMTPQRSSALPDVPAIAELGLPEAQFDSWSGIVAPRGVDHYFLVVSTSLRHRFSSPIIQHRASSCTRRVSPDSSSSS